MRILFFVGSLMCGGKERRVVELLKQLKRTTSYELLLVLTEKDIHYKEVFDFNIPIQIIERKYLKKDPRLFFKFFKICYNYKPDIIHVWDNKVAIYAIPTKIILGTPMINNQITDAPITVNKGLLSHKLTFKFSDLVIANSHAGIKVYNVVTNKNKVIYNGFDFNRISNLKSTKFIKDKFNISTKYVVGMVATFSNLKDYPTFIKAANKVLNNIPNTTFICIGGGDNSLYKRFLDPGNTNNILFFGVQKDIESIMNICDIGVLTSNVKLHGEGISNALLEFSSLAKPLIATNNGGTPEIIDNDYNGYLVEPFDVIDLSDKIKYLLKNDSKRKMLGDNAKFVVENKFGIKKMIDSYLKVYQDICVV